MRYNSGNKEGRKLANKSSKPFSSESKRFSNQKSQSRGQRSRFGTHTPNDDEDDRPRKSRNFNNSQQKRFGTQRQYDQKRQFDDEDGFQPKIKKSYRRQDSPNDISDDHGHQFQSRFKSRFDNGKTQHRTFNSRNKKSETAFTEDEGVRLNKYIANAGVCSRRDAEQYITAGVISINGKIVTELATKVHYGDVVKFNNAPLMPEKKTYILLNKPKDYVTTTDDPHAEKTVMDLIGDAGKNRVYPVGRLDRATTGLLLLTNDGDLAEHLCHPRYNKQKIYQITLDRKVAPEDIEKLLTGIVLEDGPAKADDIDYCNPDDFCEVGVVIHNGRNRIVRRMFEALNYKVKKLDRVYYAGLTKKNLPRGKWRFLTDSEITMLKRGSYN